VSVEHKEQFPSPSKRLHLEYVASRQSSMVVQRFYPKHPSPEFEHFGVSVKRLQSILFQKIINYL